MLVELSCDNFQKDATTEQSLINLYSDWDLGKPAHFNQEFTNCTSIHLNYLPYALYHTLLPSSVGVEVNFWFIAFLAR